MYRLELRRLAQICLLPVVSIAATLVAPTSTEAFCGFYVTGADARLYNNATMVVLMRDGTRTVLSMANNYQGPPEDFAMVVPVPVVLGKKDVKILPAELFDRVDKLAAPRLVEYWEVDPCNAREVLQRRLDEKWIQVEGSPRRSARDLGVRVEAEFEVGEYQIAILSAQESTGLDTWLRQENYNIPDGAQALLEPYVQGGSKFFVAKVDSKKIKFDAQGQAMLSPLRFHYDSEDFSLPLRLGLINAQGPQDLLIHILAREVRYEAANYDNVAIPTNIEVEDEVRERFGQFYAALFDHTLANNPQAVVTEYAWSADSCDPCPEPALTLPELTTLGADVLPSYEQLLKGRLVPVDLDSYVSSAFVLTRLHARYDASSLGEDMVFQAAPPIVGGRELGTSKIVGSELVHELEPSGIASPSNSNNFQARYIIRHEWAGPIECEEPFRGVFGTPWELGRREGESETTSVTRDLAVVERGAALRDFLTKSAVRQLEEDVGPLPAGPIPVPGPDIYACSRVFVPCVDSGGCAHCSADPDATGLGALGLGLLGLGLFGLRRRP
jgi:MYXO-CTERM domain-containing protein